MNLNTTYYVGTLIHVRGRATWRPRQVGGWLPGVSQLRQHIVVDHVSIYVYQYTEALIEVCTHMNSQSQRENGTDRRTA